eukprot:TRINITY_DN3520_c0_g2_i6.p1 TRINITY_DN3520_c0_g2~~TRINITY_DN3520_c0_g2_i6.p1  ORF type:complete len:261 (+),score=39.27 TRINITY_DN3520_c0_g2_i6:57-839(+)
MYLSSLRRSVWCSAPNPLPQARLICSSSRTDVMKEYNTWLKSDRGLPFKKLRDTIVGGKEDPKGRHRTRLEEAANALPPVQTVTFNPKADPDEYAQPVPAPIVEVNPVMKLASPFERHTIQQFPRPSPIRVDPYTGTMTGSGKRKTAHANVAIFLNGTGQITINGKHWIDYFPSIFVRSVMMEPIIATELINEVDIKVETWGGGFMGQAEAIRNAIAVAMVRGIFHQYLQLSHVHLLPTYYHTVDCVYILILQFIDEGLF